MIEGVGERIRDVPPGPVVAWIPQGLDGRGPCPRRLEGSPQSVRLILFLGELVREACPEELRAAVHGDNHLIVGVAHTGVPTVPAADDVEVELENH